MASAPSAGEARVGRGLTRARVVAAAADLADTEGLDALSMTRLAASLDVTQPALYNHVRGAADCLTEVGVAARLQLADRVRTATRGQRQDDALTAAGRAWRRYGRRHAGRYAAAERVAAVDDAGTARAADRLHEVLVRVIATFGLTGEAADRLAVVLQCGLRGVAALERERGPVAEVDEAFDDLLALIGAACRAASAADSLDELSPATSARPA